METSKIDNSIYDHLGNRWYSAYDDPVALLRAESKLTSSWILDEIQLHFGNSKKCKILDIGCGGGFLSNRLAESNHLVTGIDLSEESLEVARDHDGTKTVAYLHADAQSLPFDDRSFDIVTAMDFLEHVENPEKIIQQVSRVLSPGGIFFFHTFNRNFISGLVVIKFVEWFVKNTPKNMHVLRLFVKPEEMVRYCKNSQLSVAKLQGTRPNLFTKSVLKGLFSGTIPEDFSFHFTPSLLMGYVGLAFKK